MRKFLQKMVVGTLVGGLAALAGCSGRAEQSLPVAVTTAPSANQTAVAAEPQVEVIQTTADWPSYDSTESAMAAAKTVVTGRLLESHSQMIDRQGQDVDLAADADKDAILQTIENGALAQTVSRIEITNVLVGDLQIGDVIEILQDGGDFGEIRFEETSTTLLSKSGADEFLLMLNQPATSPYYFTISPEVGTMIVDQDQVEPIGDKSAQGFNRLRMNRLNDFQKVARQRFGKRSK
jgi:hypothetical protein